MEEKQLEAKKSNFEITINDSINRYEGKIDQLREALIDLKAVGNETDLKEFIDKWKGEMYYAEG